MRAALILTVLSFVACKNNLTPAEESVAATPVGPGGMPAGHPPATVEDAPKAASGDIEGRLEVAAAVADKIQPGDTIFVIARQNATQAMVAVVKLAAPKTFPLPFKLTAENVMMPGGSLSGDIKLTARVDKDGDAITKKPGDVVGEVAQAVQVPAKDVVLTLSQVL